MSDSTNPVTVEMFVFDVEKTARWYESTLGFRITQLEPGVFAAVRYEDAMLMFADSSLYSGKRTWGREYDASIVGHGIEVRVMVADVDSFYQHARQAGLPIISDLDDRDYGLRDFVFEEVNGFHIRVASRLP